MEPCFFCILSPYVKIMIFSRNKVNFLYNFFKKLKNLSPYFNTLNNWKGMV